MLFPRPSIASAVALLASSALVQPVLAQVYTDCDPLLKKCPPNAALASDATFHFNSTPKASVWESRNQGEVKYSDENGASFIVARKGDAPTLRSRFYFFWGRVEIMMKTAHGKGMISSIMLVSDCRDEIDWEIRGIDKHDVLTNYFSKGVEDFTRGESHPVPGNLQTEWHNYTIEWTKDALDFYINSQKVRTLLPKDANNTQAYPQTPMQVSIGPWAAGHAGAAEGTKEWAGGEIDFNEGPFAMHIKSVQVTDYSKAREYVYGDKTGSWESIKMVEYVVPPHYLRPSN